MNGLVPIKKIFASPEIIAYIMSQKYVLDIPLYRQEQEFKSFSNPINTHLRFAS
ncbi:MAG: transposase [Anaerovoracaceae bacterium]